VWAEKAGPYEFDAQVSAAGQGRGGVGGRELVPQHNKRPAASPARRRCRSPSVGPACRPTPPRPPWCPTWTSLPRCWSGRASPTCGPTAVGSATAAAWFLCCST